MKYIFFLLISFIMFSGCENDLDVVDKYTETTIVYCLLNPGDTSQYIRIEKSFLGEGNAYLMAQNADSLYPDSTKIQVSLQKIVNGIAIDSIIHFRLVDDII